VCGRGRICPQVWWDSLSEAEYLENPGIDGRIILNSSLKKHGSERTSLSVRGYRKMTAFCE
jgi:hypothetical protein